MSQEHPGIVSRESKRRKLAYVEEFRERLRENPHTIKTVLNLMGETVEKYNPHEIPWGIHEPIRYDKSTNQWMMGKRPMGIDRGTLLVPGEPCIDKDTQLEVTLLGRSNRTLIIGIWGEERRDLSDYFKIRLQGKSFFIKRSFISATSAFEQFHDSRTAKEVLKDVADVKVIEAQLGYQGKNEAWFIASWENLEEAGFRPVDFAVSMDDYGHDLRPNWRTHTYYYNYLSKEDFEYAQRKKKEIQDLLKPVGLGVDLGMNLFYQPSTKKFILIDLTRTQADNNQVR